MSEAQQGNPLVERILADAAAEARRTVSEAEAAAAKRREISAEEIRTIEREAAGRTAARLEALSRNTASRVNVEERRARLRARDRVVSEAQAAVRARLAALVGTSGYRRILAGWIAEAAIGLGEPEAEVNTSAAERAAVDRDLLAEAEREVLLSSGRVVRLALAKAEPLLSQGVVLTAPSGRVAYNNQLATRLLREQSRIRVLIHEALFGRGGRAGREGRGGGDGEREGRGGGREGAA